MKHMRQIVMILALIALAVGGYMAYQRYYAPQEDVQVQFLNFGGNYEDGDDFHRHHDSNWRAGYEAGKHDASN
ncbi:MAG: hypothetical protein Q8Q60_05255 [Candidatus Chromulinivorax sp.]|nr:hypothetical protein [Candidatus Chromulinivorax sp.]